MTLKSTAVSIAGIVSTVGIASGIYLLATSDFSDAESVDAGSSAIVEKRRYREHVIVDNGTAYTCGTVKDLARWQKLADPKSAMEIACKKAVTKETRCAMCGKDLCRYGRAQGDKTCDPDAEGCKPWPCEVVLGDDPAEIAEQPVLRTSHIAEEVSIDAGHK